MDWIEARPAADCVFISDGEARPSETARRWRSFREETGARLMYVAVARGYGAIEELADQVFGVGDLIGDEADAVAREAGRWMR